jgi:hypothetical protein
METGARTSRLLNKTARQRFRTAGAKRLMERMLGDYNSGSGLRRRAADDDRCWSC